MRRTEIRGRRSSLGSSLVAVALLAGGALVGCAAPPAPNAAARASAVSGEAPSAAFFAAVADLARTTSDAAAERGEAYPDGRALLGDVLDELARRDRVRVGEDDGLAVADEVSRFEKHLGDLVPEGADGLSSVDATLGWIARLHDAAAAGEDVYASLRDVAGDVNAALATAVGIDFSPWMVPLLAGPGEEVEIAFHVGDGMWSGSPWSSDVQVYGFASEPAYVIAKVIYAPKDDPSAWVEWTSDPLDVTASGAARSAKVTIPARDGADPIYLRYAIGTSEADATPKVLRRGPTVVAVGSL